MSLLSELKRRNVIRVALLYLVASWLVIQVADVGISLLSLPVWSGRLVFLLLMIGFPLVVVFSWVYELTPEGLKRERDVDRSESITSHTARKLNIAVVVLLVVALAGLLLDRLVPEAPAPEAGVTVPAGPVPSATSIAVLPFVNMSSDEQNEYFSDGLSEELLNLLARIPELQVAARTSAFTFKNSDADIDEIATKLNVAHVLEGSVRKSGDEIRVTAQLIKAADGYHLWSETFDRKLTDVFAIQDEIAGSVVDALKVSLLGDLPKSRVTDPEVYALYLRSLAAANQRSDASMEEAVQLLTRALAIDPDYVEGWVELSVVQNNRVGMGLIPRAEGFALAKAAAERALRLDPRAARAMSGLAWVAMYWEWDFARAARLLGDARRLEPGNASVLNTMAVLQGVFGRRQSMISLYEEALNRDPVSVSVLGNLTGAYASSGRLDAAATLVARMAEVAPDSGALHFSEGLLNFYRGDAEASIASFARLDSPASDFGRAFALFDLGRDAEADAAVTTLETDGAAVQVAVIEAYRGNTDRAFEWLERAYDDHEDWLIEARMYTAFEGLYGDPRWAALLEKVGISDADAERIGL